jgi:hypothetical protein
MSHPFRSQIRHVSHKLVRNVTEARANRHIIKYFTEKNSLTYFGSVNQHSDDHKVVRGFTVSLSHQDDNYSVGSVGGYDIILVNRSDAIWQPDGSIVVSDWLIVTFDLHTKRDIPHLFLYAKELGSKAYESLFASYRTMKEIHLGTFEAYTPEFLSRFSLYSQPSFSIDVERLFPADTARVLAAHFWPLSAELHNGILYVYSSNKQVKPQLLDVMLEDGLWLANHLDTRAELI